MADHAFLSASSAGRWMHCPGSPSLASKYPSTGSAAADEGTHAHAVAQIMIEYNAGDLTKAEKEKQLKERKELVDKFYEEHPELPGSFDAMVKILEPYVSYVWERFQELKQLDEASVLMAEQKVKFDEYVPGGFGTSDVVLIGAGKAIVIDLKYGKGVPVSAVNNPQIRLYEIGAINEFSLMYDFDRVEGVIYQPRLDSVTSQELSVKELREWAEKEIKPAATEAAEGHGHFTPGPWCDNYFCPAQAKCKTRAKWVLEMEKYSVKDPELLTDEELGELLPRLKALQDFVKKAENYAIGAISTGHPIKGWKLIEGTARRKYKDEEAVAAAVLESGYSEKDIYKRSVLGITDMTTLLGKKQFKAILEDAGLVYKPPGAPKLAPEDDPHESFNPAAADFAD